MFLNADAPLVYGHIRNEFLHNHQGGSGEFTEAAIVGVNSVEGRALSFMVLLKNGALWHRRPVHAFCLRPCAPLPLATVSLWDCFGYDIAVTRFRFLNGLTARVFCGDGVERRGEYLFTVDWCGEGYPEVPDQHKCAHVLALEDGNLAAMPNNRLVWIEKSWTEVSGELPRYTADGHIYSAERDADA